jgi:phospholipase C
MNFFRHFIPLFLLPVFFLPVSASAQIEHFQHIVVVIQENRTPDNLFQGLCAAPYGACAVPPTPSAPYDIQTSNWNTKNGVIQPGVVALDNDYDLNHAHVAFNAMCDIAGNPASCRMDGAAGVECIPNPGETCPANASFQYVDNSTGILDPYLALASQYGWANYMFQTNQGPSFPAHQILFGGTSAPSQEDDGNGIYAAEQPLPITEPIVGCIAPSSETVRLIVPSLAPDPPYGVEDSTMYPCFDHQTMADLVSDWMYYGFARTGIWVAPNAIDHICVPENGVCTGWGHHVNANNPSEVFTDLGKCKFHNLVWVTPTMANSDHAQGNDGGGPSWVASIVNAIGNSKCTDIIDHRTLTYWQDTAILIVWDDWGGWYDHEGPSILAMPYGDYQNGFRVPFIFVSAYTPAQYVDNSRSDFGSILRFIENNFAGLGLTEGELGFADSRSTTDLSGFYKLTSAPRAFVTIAAPKSADFFINDPRPPEPPDND